MIGIPALHPLLVKEMSGVSRRWQTYAGRVIYVGLAGGVLLLVWASSNFANGVSPSELALVGRRLFGWLTALQIVLMTASAVMAASDMICGEARAGTLGLLLLSGLSPRSIARAKWQAAMVQTGALFLGGLPVASACFYLGGVGVWSLAWSASVTLSMAALGAAIGLCFSATSPTPARAALCAFAALAIYCLFPIFAFPLVFVAPYFHPVYAAFVADAQDMGLASEGWISATLVSFVAVAGLLRATASRIDRAPQEAPRAVEPGQDAATLGGWYGISRLRPRDGRADRRGVWDDRPLLWKELVTRPAARMRPEVKVISFVYFVLIALLAWLLTLGQSSGAFCFTHAFFLVLAVAVGASLFSREISDRRLEMLLASPVSSARIVGAKLVAGLVSPEGLLTLGAWLISVPAYSWWAGPRGMLVYLAISGFFLAFAYALAAAASLRARTMRGAALLAMGVLAAILAGPPLLESILDPAGGVFEAIRSLRALHPQALLAGGPDAASSLPLYAGCYGLATGLLFSAMPWLFNRATGRCA